MTRLGSKQTSSNQDWLDTIATIEQIVPLSALKKCTKETLKRIKNTTKDKKCAYAWSAGKDSIVLGHLCEQVGITDSMIAVCNLEYPAFMAWIEANKPKNCLVMNSGQDLAWLKKHPQMLFPRSSAITGRWFAIVQHKLQADYFNAQGLDILLLGRRHADGNYTGKDGIYTNAKGITRFSPLYDWPHEYILAYIHYNKLPLPPIYNWKDGFVRGTHPWPARTGTTSEGQGWQEVYDIDPSIVEQAAAYMPGAAFFLKERR